MGVAVEAALLNTALASGPWAVGGRHGHNVELRKRYNSLSKPT